MTPRIIVSLISCLFITQQASAAISLDRTRVIYDGSSKSISLNISNENKELPYLAQGWVEDEKGNKLVTPFTVLPPIQRLEPGAKSQIRVQGLPEASQLPQDRETLFYFNLREIPPRSDQPNTLQLALQTRVKLFYRPSALTAVNTKVTAPWQEQLTLTRESGKYRVHNPTPYYVTLIDAVRGKEEKSVDGFSPLMISPNSSDFINVSASSLGEKPVLVYINDFGGRPKLHFTCTAVNCSVSTAGNSK